VRKYLFIGLCCLVVVAAGIWFLSRRNLEIKSPAPTEPAPNVKATLPVEPEKVIDYGRLKETKDSPLAELMKERKAGYGVNNSLDMIVKSDETIKVGDNTVPMKKILDEVRLQQGEILETDLQTGRDGKTSQEYGIHVVQPEDNIWDIHFRLLKEYYNHKGIQVSPLADEPDRLGRSSGVGKLLKFSEHMVHIYNVKEGKLETNLDQIYPLTKVVVYNMSHIFALLDRIDYKDVNRIEFDGETLWLPAEM
jgi:hypothetical protein